MSKSKTAEQMRLDQDSRRERNWKRWGPYLSERQWGTVREDYSSDGESWNYFPHDHSRSRAYRWGEDGLLGITDRQCRICFCLGLWNENDSILKERLFGLAGPEGNHGEDVKECYYYLDSTPTHSYLRGLYKYPQAKYPYRKLLEENRNRDRNQPEYELIDTGVFANDEYFDVQVEYAKVNPNDILIRITVSNRSAQKAPLHFIPQIWFRNTWNWGRIDESSSQKPQASLVEDHVQLEHDTLGTFLFSADPANQGFVNWLFTENETNNDRHVGQNPDGTYFKDAFHRYVVHGETDSVNPDQEGTKCSPYYHIDLDAGEETAFRFRLCSVDESPVVRFGEVFEAIFSQRVLEYEEFYHSCVSEKLTDEEHNVNKQSYAGLLWTKQFYHYAVEDWFAGDPKGPGKNPKRIVERNRDWQHLYNRDVISMPDKWEYPWYAAWDLAFHVIPFSRIDPDFAKEQMVLFLREWYLHPNGQIPAYEWGFSDVNPPVHAWACWQVYLLTKQNGSADTLFLSRTFQKLLLNFTWWVNRKDVRGNHVFSGGFLGLDNIGIFDRSKPLPTGGHLEQADGSAWMAFYCSSMLSMALELAPNKPNYGDMASKFFEHYVSIAEAMNIVDGRGLWDEDDGFYYDHLYDDGHAVPLKIRSLVGLLPLITVVVLHDDQITGLPGFQRRMNWFLEKNNDIDKRMSYFTHQTENSGKCMLAVPSIDRLRRILRYLFDENEFLSDFGIRSLSKVHEKHPYVFRAHGHEYKVSYVPGESDSPMFGGNSNWRGPIWFPMNYLIIEALNRYHEFFGDQFKIEFPTGSGNEMNLAEAAREIECRLLSIFSCGCDGRPCHQDDSKYGEDPNWKDLVLFYEYFHGDNGGGLGASHQTGWTALVSRLFDMKYSQ